MVYFVVFLTCKSKIDSNIFYLEHCFWCNLLNFAFKNTTKE